jgi:hypothetical protein
MVAAGYGHCSPGASPYRVVEVSIEERADLDRPLSA